MSALAASSEYLGGSTMPRISHITKINQASNFRICPADPRRHVSYNANVARRGIPKGQIRWYLREWMAVAGMGQRGGQTKMRELTGWSMATMSQLYNDQQDYSPKILEEAAAALNVEPFELLIPPERAMALRRLRESAAQIVRTEPEASPEPTKTSAAG